MEFVYSLFDTVMSCYDSKEDATEKEITDIEEWYQKLFDEHLNIRTDAQNRGPSNATQCYQKSAWRYWASLETSKARS